MEQNRDLAIQEILNNSKPETIEVGISSTINRKEHQLSTEADFNNEALQDLVSNRLQREKFTKQIILIMCSEIAFIAFLILGVFMVNCLNALVPQISFNFPPIFLTISVIFAYACLYKFVDKLPNIRVSSKKIKLKKHEISLNYFLKVILTIILLIVLNIFAREHHTIYFDKIVLTENVIHMILYTALAVFAKTTFLASYIIRGLYDALNKSDRNKKEKIS